MTSYKQKLLELSLDIREKEIDVLKASANIHDTVNDEDLGMIIAEEDI